MMRFSLTNNYYKIPNTDIIYFKSNIKASWNYILSLVVKY